MEQDRNLQLQQSHDRLGQISDLAVAQLAETLGGWSLSLHELNALPPPPSLLSRLPAGSTFILISDSSVSIYPRRPLLFTPIPPHESTPPPGIFDAIDVMELRDQQYDRAIAALQPLTHSSGSRAEALLRIGRIENKAGQKEAALETYKLLANEGSLNPSGTPYALLASTARYRILRELGRQSELSKERELLRSDLLEGRWAIRHETFQYYWSVLDQRGDSSAEPPDSSVDFAVLVSDLYERWQSVRSQNSGSGGRRIRADSSLLLWSSTPDRLSALVTPPDALSSTLKLPANARDIQWKLASSRGASVTNSQTAIRSLAEAQLLGHIEFFSARPILNTESSRHGLWFVGVALMLLVVLGSGYVLHRAIGRELQVAQLQSDFVAAVSHEFRSPLTTLRTITELLAQDRIPDEQRRRQSYVFLDRETNRLHRLVEDLLDFGRMESRRKQYHMNTYDAFQLVRAAVSDVGEHAAAGGFHVETHLDSIEAPIRADEEAFRRTVRNLLENAMKYSPECRTVWVDGEISSHQVSISVRDQGMGIEPFDQQAIFQKFVRGQAAKKAGIKGTGIGLAMVQQITKAMGGEIRLQSEVGVGSTFTLVIPLADD
jgi:signal transduction histidine kinase